MSSSSRDLKNDRNESAEDDEFGDYEGAEDDAPESVQAMAGPSPWAIFPDLLRVQTNKNRDEAEAVNKNLQITTAGHSRITSTGNQPPVDQTSGVRGAIGRETGAIPKQRLLDPPDVSLLSQVKLPTTLDLCNTTIRPAARESQPTVASRLNASERSASNDCSTVTQLAQLERDLKAAQTQKAVLQQQLLQKDTQIRELQSQQRHAPALNEWVVTNLVDTMEGFKTDVGNTLKQLEERMNSLEEKLPSIIASAMEAKTSPFKSNPTTNNQIFVDSTNDVKLLLDQQKKELENERKIFLLTFSDILKKTSENLQNNIDMNGPKTNK